MALKRRKRDRRLDGEDEAGGSSVCWLSFLHKAASLVFPEDLRAQDN